MVQACILFSVSQALVRGGTAVTVQSMPGTVTGGGGGSSQAYAEQAKKILREGGFRRTL